MDKISEHQPNDAATSSAGIAKEQGVELFDDLDLTALWWDTHSFMNADQRLTMARQVLALCKNDECREMLRIIIADLEMFVAPKRLSEVAMERLQSIVKQHPYFSGMVAVSVLYMLLSAGMSISDLVRRFMPS